MPDPLLTIQKIPVNLDVYEIDELQALEDCFMTTAAVLKDLAAYARGKALARQYHEAGKTEQAHTCEIYCQNIYSRLPAWARWDTEN